MNVADTDMALGLLHGDGYARTDDPARADLILLNTCAVREKAEERVFARASMLAEEKARPGVILGITGCMAEHLKDKILARAPYVDLVLGPDGYRRLVEHVDSARRSPGAVVGKEKPGAGLRDTALDRFETYEGLDPARAKTGGLTEALALAQAAKELNFKIMVGCMVATSLAMAPAMLVAQLAQVIDLDGPLLLARDRNPGISFDGSLMYPPEPELWG